MERDKIVKIYKKSLNEHRTCSYDAFLKNWSKFGWVIVEETETPLQMRNVQVILKKIKADMAKILAEHTINPSMTTKEFSDKMRTHLLEFLPKIYEDFDINLFDLDLVPVLCRLCRFFFQPHNFITALWLQGVQVLYSEIKEKNHHIDKIAKYTWNDEEKLLRIEIRHTNIQL